MGEAPARPQLGRAVRAAGGAGGVPDVLGPEPRRFLNRLAAEDLHQDPVPIPVIEDVDEVPQDDQDVAFASHGLEVIRGSVQVGDGRHPHRSKGSIQARWSR